MAQPIWSKPDSSGCMGPRKTVLQHWSTHAMYAFPTSDHLLWWVFTALWYSKLPMKHQISFFVSKSY